MRLTIFIFKVVVFDGFSFHYLASKDPVDNNAVILDKYSITVINLLH